MNNFEQETYLWIKDFVIKNDLCPFASEPFHKNELSFKTLDSFSQIDLQSIQNNQFLIFPQVKNNFEDFYSEVSNLYHQDFHFIAFHPQFCFEGLALNETANMVNQSPFPMIHIIEANQMDQARLTIKQGENISLKNEEKLKKLFQES